MDFPSRRREAEAVVDIFSLEGSQRFSPQSLLANYREG
jgi:hypothetical protein